MNSKIYFSIFYLFALMTLFSCQKSLEDIVAETEKATFIIYTFDEYGSPLGSGSGFFIEQSGVGITNYHVLDGSVKAIIKLQDSTEYEIDKIIASDANYDIVKFQIKNLNQIKFSILNFSKNTPLKGAKVYNISSPKGLETTVSEGIVSSIRMDKHYGETLQTTTPISSGSSGSPFINEKGEVIAVATFQILDGQNLNFGVIINDEIVKSFKTNDFLNRNPKFNTKENFIILNSPNDKGSFVILNAIEFSNSATILYLSFTNLMLGLDDDNLQVIWCDLDKKDEGFLIQDIERDNKYYITSSTIGTSKANGTQVPLASTIKFKVYFPPIKDDLKKINITYGNTSRGWKFSNIDLEKFKKSLNVDYKKYHKDLALSLMKEGELNSAMNMLSELIQENPYDEECLNAMGIVSYVKDNNSDALRYFSLAEKYNPNNPTSLVNKHFVYKHQNKIDAAIEELNKAINIDSAQPDYHIYRSLLFYKKQDLENALKDLDIALLSDDFKNNPNVLEFRAIVNSNLGNFNQACIDVEVAYNNTSDPTTQKRLLEMWNGFRCE